MTAAKTEPKGLHAKLAEVMAEAERIPKNGRAPAAMGGYPFVQVGDAADAIRRALAERGVSMLPSAVDVVSEGEYATKSGGSVALITIRTTWTLTDAETGQSAVIQSLGTGGDSGDKASPKAQTNAMKYALLMGFLLSTGDDPEGATIDQRDETSGAERVEILGNLQKTGTLQKGTAAGYQAEWRQAADGHAIGLRLKLDDEDRDIPQVLIKGAIGEALFVTAPELAGQRVTIKGRLFSVSQKGRTTYYRLVVGDNPEHDFVQGADWRVPALDVPTEAPSVPLFSEEEQAALDAAVDAVLS